MRSETSKNLRLYYQGSILGMVVVMAGVFLGGFLLLQMRDASSVADLYRILNKPLLLVGLMGLLLMALTGAILSLVGLIQLRRAHPAFWRALAAMFVGVPFALLEQYAPGVLGSLGGIVGTAAGLASNYYVIQGASELLTAQQNTMDLPEHASGDVDRLIRRGWLSWRLNVVPGVALCALDLLPYGTGPLMIVFLGVMLVLSLAAWGLLISFLMRSSRLL